MKLALVRPFSGHRRSPGSSLGIDAWISPIRDCENNPVDESRLRAFGEPGGNRLLFCCAILIADIPLRPEPKTRAMSLTQEGTSISRNSALCAGFIFLNGLSWA
jgi:hypothetical protein